MKLLLDTAVFLWLSYDAPEISEKARDAFQDPSHDVFLSVVSAWEIGVKSQLGKLPLPTPAEVFVPSLREQLSVASLPLDEPSTLHLAKLPSLHRDPFDRMLICQAIEHGLTLLTPDHQLRQYPVRTLW